jgi:hypothetical protein
MSDEDLIEKSNKTIAELVQEKTEL